MPSIAANAYNPAVSLCTSSPRSIGQFSMAYPGILIVFEGIDGAGKTTQINRLREALKRAGEIVIQSKEPTDGHWGRLIRESAKGTRMPLADELHAFVEDRREHLADTVLPALDRGAIVVRDRYF